MEKFLARFKPYRKRSKDGSTSSTSSAKSTARPTGPAHSSSSQSGKREHTVGMSRSSSGFVSTAETESKPEPTAAPRIDLDFKIPGERTILDPPAPVSHEEHPGEQGDAKDLLVAEKKALDRRRFTPEAAASAWAVSGRDLLAVGLKSESLFDLSLDHLESTRQEFYRLAAIFTISTNPSCLADYPSLSDYFPPPAFVTEDHDWSADYSSYSGYVRNPQVLVHFLKWVTKRVKGPDPGSRSESGMPEWYRKFSEQEIQEDYPLSAWHGILPSYISSSYCRYLEELFDRVALISANEADNGSSIDYMCGILGWWLLDTEISASTIREEKESDRLDVLEERWKTASKAMGHLFRCWVRAQNPDVALSQLPLLVRNLVEGYRGDIFDLIPISSQRILCLQVTNELEHDQLPLTTLSQEELGVGLIREAKYGSPVSLAGWQDQADEGSGASDNSLFRLLSQSTTATGETLADFDPAVVPPPQSPHSPFETRTVYKPFRKVSTSSFFTDLNTTPLPTSRSNSWLPSSEPIKPSSSSSSIAHLGVDASRPIAGLTASKDDIGEEADWKTFSKSGFGEETKPMGLQLGDAFVEKGADQLGSRNIDKGYQTLGRQQPSGPLSPSTPRSASHSSRRQVQDVIGVFTIDDLGTRDVAPAFLAFLRDAEIDRYGQFYANWPFLLILRADDNTRTIAHVKGEWIVVTGTRKHLPPAPAPTIPPPAEKRPLPASPSVNSTTPQTPSTITGTSSKRAKTYRRTSIFGMLSMGSSSKPRSPPSGPGSPASLEQSTSAGLQSALVGEMGQLQSRETAPSTHKGSALNASSLQRPRAASATSRKQVPGMLDDVRVEPSSSLDPVEDMQTTSSSANPVAALQKPIEITASDSKGNLVDLEESNSLQSNARISMEREDMANPPETPTESLRPGTAGTDMDMVMSTPQRGRRSAAPSPDSALAEPVVSRSSTPEPMNINPDQPSELPEGVTELTLSDPSLTKSEMSLPGAEGLIQLGAALPITSTGHTKTAEPNIVASSMLEEEDAAASIRGPPTFVRALVAGAVAGLSVDLMFYPIDTIKTRLQSQQGFVKAGGFKGIYKGVGSVGVGSAPGAAAFFTAYENLKVNLPKQSATFSNNPALTHMFAASGGEFMACLIRVPTEIVKSRTQTSAYGAGASSLMSATNVWKLEGLRGFYRGFGITLAREIPFTAIQFPLYESLKTKLSENYLPDKRKPLAHEAAVCGMIAGGIAAALTTPLDVVKTRAMLEAKATKADGASRRAASVLSIPTRLAQITSQEGVKALFAGVVPRTMWISLGGAVFLGAYDLVSDPFQIKM